MSELIHSNGRRDFRWHLLTSVSALALVGSICAIDAARADSDDGDRPTIWIELGGQVERQTGQGDPYDPPGVANYSSSLAYKPISPLQVEKPPLFGNGAEAKLSFQPEDSDWVFSASMRYGRANGSKTRYHNTPGQNLSRVYETRTYPASLPVSSHTFGQAVFHCCKTVTYANPNPAYADIKATHRDSHTILDFQAGKEVGLGLFGQSSESVFGVGVRFAQFSAKSSVSIHGKPDPQFYNHATSYFLQHYPQKYFPTDKFHVFAASASSQRSFRGMGPSLSWNASTALLGNAQAGVFSFDWGVNAAVLFGRRTAKGQHHESGHYHHAKYYPANSHYYTNSPPPFDRNKTVTVPNVGGFAGVSFKFPNAKISMGYRGDFFFGAMDTGIDTERTKTVGFYGPFASISFGFGG
ncbi:MAG TPA: hypothetical protein VIJ62_14450 [Rhizomicrobium sp.]